MRDWCWITQTKRIKTSKICSATFNVASHCVQVWHLRRWSATCSKLSRWRSAKDLKWRVLTFFAPNATRSVYKQSRSLILKLKLTSGASSAGPTSAHSQKCGNPTWKKTCHVISHPKCPTIQQCLINALLRTDDVLFTFAEFGSHLGSGGQKCQKRVSLSRSGSNRRAQISVVRWICRVNLQVWSAWTRQVNTPWTSSCWPGYYVACSEPVGPERCFYNTQPAHFDCRRSLACTIYWMKSESTTGFYHYINFAPSSSLAPLHVSTLVCGPVEVRNGTFFLCFVLLRSASRKDVLPSPRSRESSHLIYRHRATTGIYIYRFIETIFH